MKGQFNVLIHAPNRLHICALLNSTKEIEFKTLRDQLEVSDSVLSKQLKALEDAGLIVASKRMTEGRPRNWLRLSVEGRKAFAQHVEALKHLIDSN